jgi:hypothetical protein
MQEEVSMPSRDWILPTNLPLCFYADQFYRTTKDSLFSQLSDTTTPEQFEEAQATLLTLRQEVEQDMPRMHYASQFGTHVCVGALYKEASLRLRNFALLKPEQQPEPAPPRQAPLTYEDILTLLEKLIPPDTFFGEEREGGS